MARREELSDEQWSIIEPLLGEMTRREEERGGDRGAKRAKLSTAFYGYCAAEDLQSRGKFNLS